MHKEVTGSDGGYHNLCRRSNLDQACVFTSISEQYENGGSHANHSHLVSQVGLCQQHDVVPLIYKVVQSQGVEANLKHTDEERTDWQGTAKHCCSLLADTTKIGHLYYSCSYGIVLDATNIEFRLGLEILWKHQVATVIKRTLELFSIV